MIKKIQIEIVVLSLILINIFVSHGLDISIYNYFSKLNYGFGGTYLKEFFVSITKLGDSVWYFSIIFFVFLFSFLGIKTKIISLNSFLNLRNFSLFCFSYLLLVGLTTQIIKHVIGRPRPNHADFESSFIFNFFSTSSEFHSFPSGHSSTIIAVTLIAGLILPGLKIFFYLCGFLIALSRVVVGAHYITDVVAGATLSIMLFKVLSLLIENKYPKFSYNNFRIKNISLFVKSMIVFIVIGFFVTLGSQFDLFFSGLFYTNSGNFLLQSYSSFSIIFREIILPALLIYIFILPFLSLFIPIKNIFFGYTFSLREMVFIWVSGAITLILIINILFKNMWGRARPNDILNFGGDAVFTPWYKLGESCFSNCSFVSGDSSVGFMFVIFYLITKIKAYFYLALFFGISLGVVRIMAGGHFFSDIVFSNIIVTASLMISIILYNRLYDK